MARHETRQFTRTTDYDDVVGVVNNQQLAEAARREKTQPFAKYSTLKPGLRNQREDLLADTGGYGRYPKQ